MGRIWAVTGEHRLPHDFTVHPETTVIEALEELRDRGVDEVRFGGAEGVDTIALGRAPMIFGPGPDVRKVVVVPAAPYNDEHVAWALDAGLVEVEYAPEGRSDAESYMLWNDALVAPIDGLLAFPRTSREAIRSGTWATVRRARQAGAEVILRPLT